VIFARHSGGGNGLFLDAHAKWLKPENVKGHLTVQ
jgi:prepilin-type processing-associated H-X9-DG protein